MAETDAYRAVADEAERRFPTGEVSQIMATSNQLAKTAVLALDNILLNHP